MTFRLQDVPRFLFPAGAAAPLERFLQERGDLGLEGFIFFGGPAMPGDARISHAVFPRQRASRSIFGVSVTVESQEVAEIVRLLAPEGVALYGKAHSHPDQTGHGELDDANLIMKIHGAFSLVVPDFGYQGFSLDRCAVYRCDPGGWKRLRGEEVGKQFVMAPGEVKVLDRNQ